MTRKAVSGLLPQYQKNAGGSSASGYWLKFYELDSGSTAVPKSIFTELAGGAELDKCKLNTRGETISNQNDDDSTFIPYVSGDYDAYLFLTESDADNNNTINATFLGTNETAAEVVSDAPKPEFQTVADLKTGTATNYAQTVDFSQYLNRKVSLVWNNEISKEGTAEYLITNVNPNNLSTLVNGIWVGANHALPDGFYAKLVIENGAVNVDQLGAVGDYYTDRDGTIKNPAPTDDSLAFQVAPVLAFQIKFSDRAYFYNSAKPIDLSYIDNGTPRSQWRVTGASRMKSVIKYGNSENLFLCTSRGGTNTYFEHMRLSSDVNNVRSSSNIIINETTSSAIKLESATRVTIHDCYIDGFANGIFAENVAGLWCEFLTLNNTEIFRNLTNIKLRVNGGTNSFTGMDIHNTIIHTIPEIDTGSGGVPHGAGIGFDMGEGCYVYNSKIGCEFVGQGDPSEICFIARAGAGGNSNCEQTEFDIWSENAGKVVIEDGAKVDGNGFWKEHLGQLVIEDNNTAANKTFQIFENGQRTWYGKPLDNPNWGFDTITKFTPGISPGASPISGLHAVDGAGRSPVLAMTDSPNSAIVFAVGTLLKDLIPVAYVDSGGGYHAGGKAARYFNEPTAPATGASDEPSGSVKIVEDTQRDIDCRPLAAYTSDTNGTTPYALSVQMIYPSSTRPSAPITGQQMWYTTTSEPSWYNGSGWVEATVSASDQRLKTEPEQITDAELDVVSKLKIIKYKWKDSEKTKGGKARYHFGVIAQDIVKACNESGVNIDKFAPLILSTVPDDYGNVIGEIWQVRHTEIQYLMIEHLRRKAGKK